MIRDPAAIVPLMGTAGWGKSGSESLRTAIEPSIDLLSIRLGGQDAECSYTPTDRNPGRSRTRETSSNVEPRIQSYCYETIRTNGAQESHAIIGSNHAAWSG